MLMIWVTCCRAEKTVFFEAETPKYIQVQVPANSVYYKRTFEIFTEDLYGLSLTDSFEVIGKPQLIIQPVSGNRISKWTAPCCFNLGSTREVACTTVELNFTNLHGYPPLPSAVSKLKFFMQGGVVNSVSQPESLIKDSGQRYDYYGQTFSPNNGRYLACVSIQAKNSHQLWVLDRSVTPMLFSRVAEDYTGSISDPDWGEDLQSHSFIFFEDSNRLRFYDFTAKKVIKIYNSGEAHTADDYVNLSKYKLLSRPKVSLNYKKLLFTGESKNLLLADLNIDKKQLENFTFLTNNPLKGYDLSSDAKAVVAAIYYRSKFVLAIFDITNGQTKYIDLGKLEPANPCWGE